MASAALLALGIVWATGIGAQEANAPAAEGPDWFKTVREIRAQIPPAANAGDWEGAWRLNRAALGLQPGHSGLLRQAVLIANATGDGPRLKASLSALADAGGTFPIERVSEALGSDEEREALTARFAINAAPLGEADTALEVALPDALIEAVVVDHASGTAYLGSVAQRRIYRVRLDAPEQVEVFADSDDGLYSVFGMALEPDSSRLYVTTGTVPQTGLAEGEGAGTALVVFDTRTGDVVARHTHGRAGIMTDVTLAHGRVYVSDTETPNVFRLGAEGLEIFATDSRFASLQGLAPLGDDLVVADYALGLWRVDGETGAVRVLRVPDGSQSLIGLDGLAALPGGDLLAVRNGFQPHTVLRLSVDAAGVVTAITPELRAHPLFDEPTLLNVAGGQVYLVAGSQWPLFPGDGSAPERERRNPVILTWPVE